VVLLTLPEINGSYLGANIAHYLLYVIKQFSLREHLSFFMADNVLSNDKALAILK
jgi:hypothetical protein